MQQLLMILMRYRAFGVWLLLEIIAVWLTIRHNNFQRLSFFSTANAFVASVLEVRDNVQNYFNLSEVNQKLLEENALLYEQIKALKGRTPTIERSPELDSVMALKKNYKFIPVRIIKNSVAQSNNYILLNKGSKDGVKPNMGVITSNGIIGKVKDCSENFSTVYSLLHTNVKVSAQIKRNRELCTVQWDGKDYREAEVLFVSRHVDVRQGDTVTSSVYNPVFPGGFPIGVINFVEKNPAMTYINIRIRLFLNFNEVEYAYVVNNLMQNEAEKLEEGNEPKKNKPNTKLK
jgi:rod shape-determining protein MreC